MVKIMSEKVLTRAEISQKIYNNLGLSFSESEILTDQIILNTIKLIVAKNELKISNFGSFYVRNKKARIGRNPKTMKEALIKSRKVISFYASENLKKRVNK